MSYSRNQRRHTSHNDRKHHTGTPHREKLKQQAERRGQITQLRGSFTAYGVFAHHFEDALDGLTS